MKKNNFKILISVVLIIAIACTIGAQSVSALTPSGSDLLSQLVSAGGSMGSSLGGILESAIGSTINASTTVKPTASSSAKNDLGKFLSLYGVKNDKIMAIDLINYLQAGGTFDSWAIETFGDDVIIPASVKNMSSDEIVSYVMTSVLGLNVTTTLQSGEEITTSAVTAPSVATTIAPFATNDLGKFLSMYGIADNRDMAQDLVDSMLAGESFAEWTSENLGEDAVIPNSVKPLSGEAIAAYVSKKFLGVEISTSVTTTNAPDYTVHTTKAETTTKAEITTNQEISSILDEYGISSNAGAMLDLINYLRGGGSFSDWLEKNYGVTNDGSDMGGMTTEQLIDYVIGLIAGTTAPAETTKYQFVTNPNTTMRQTAVSTFENTTQMSSVKPGTTGQAQSDTTEIALEYILGDVTGDGKVTAADARFVLRISAGLVNADEIQINAANVDGDDRISASDARLVLRFSAGLISSF